MLILNKIKKSVALAALDYVCPGTIIGVGSGSTVSYFIESLSQIKDSIDGVVSSSIHSTNILNSIGIPVFELDMVDSLSIYVDGADEINDNMQMIKGGGAALTKEKVISYVADRFICIVDSTKKVNKLGRFPLPVEIIPMSYSLVSDELIKFGGIPKIRNNVITEHGNIIIDVHNLNINDPIYTENFINSLPGVVTVGLFALKQADILLIGTELGIKTIIK
ncbi:ribose-5-phosphate isomerase RpiA [Buchnera aphidicola]|uniref:ribose-5-phosphate isomerase RpiA n=1 Tax=Buchnera aphidicola TaxID=9 RepID=UPI0031B8A1ED